MMKRIWERYKDIIPYLFYGVCTTVINIIVYWAMAHILKLTVMLSTIIAWTAAVSFAYITNRTRVFKSQANNRNAVIKEVFSFFACRLGTGIIDWLCMFVFVELLHINDVVIKTLANILVIIINYIASKFVIFKNNRR